MEDITIDNTVDDINIINKKQVSQTNNTSNLPNPIVVNPVPIVVNPISNTTNEKESNAIQPILSFKPITQNITTTKKGEEKESDHDNTPINILINNNSNNNDKIDNKSKEKSNEVLNNEVLDEEVLDNEVIDNEVLDNEVLDEVSNNNPSNNDASNNNVSKNEVSNNEVSNSSISYSKDESFTSNYSEDKEVTEEKTDLSSKTV